MPNKNAIRGKNLERLLVNKAKEKGFKAIRAWGSNGKALGMDETVDLLIEDIRIQAKKRKKIADYLSITEHYDVVAVQQDRQEAMIIMPFNMFLEFLAFRKKVNEM